MKRVNGNGEVESSLEKLAHDHVVDADPRLKRVGSCSRRTGHSWLICNPQCRALCFGLNTKQY